MSASSTTSASSKPKLSRPGTERNEVNATASSNGLQGEGVAGAIAAEPTRSAAKIKHIEPNLSATARAQSVLRCPPMPHDKPERRTQPRIPAQVPVTINATDPSLKASGQTRDLSSSGIFFYTNFPIATGNNVEMVLILPPELTAGEKRWVCCQATVVRVENNVDGNAHGVAAQVRTMEFLPEIAG